ncbi:MAG: SusC/RagA family TonB-linked outer membrane protein [Prevotella sp.]|nr:SusC/RagA family TonB-linked outer membrane protein [Prevotella sp.]
MKQLKFILLTVMCMLALGANAQQITSVHGTVSDDMGPLMGATVCEIDATGRIIESALTDLNGNFTMKVRNEKDKIRFSYVGLKTQTLPINKTTFKIMMTSATQLKEVVVKSKKRLGGNNLAIPEKEISFATQSISMKEFEGLGITTVDEALQGRIAGLDIISGGDLGSGSTMRLRGTASVNELTNGNPLIVVDGNIRNDLDLSDFQASSATNEKFADLLNINPEDILTVNVLKDASATAIYGSQGGSGVIELTTKRGTRGKPRLTYSLKLTGTYQPKGYKLLSGDDYTMLLKESYFNPKQSDEASNIKELNYDPTFSEYEQYNNNTDWYDAVTQWGLRQNHYLTIEGGGEKARFRISGGFDHETGSIIEQKLNRFSTRVNLDYNVSDRISVSTNFAMTYTKNHKNTQQKIGNTWYGLLGIAMMKMPNMSIYEQNPATGEDTDAYYTMLQSGSSVFDGDQKVMVNPVASARLAKNITSTYDMNPELIINYKLLGMDDDHWRLDYRGSVYMNINNNYDDTFYPAELVTTSWSTGGGVNTSSSGSSKSVRINTKHQFVLTPAFKNKDHSASLMGRFELDSSTWSNQSANGKGLPSGGITSPDAGGLITGLASGYGEGRSVNFVVQGHYSYKDGLYSFTGAVRAEGTTRFGPDKRWVYYPSASLRWNVNQEKWMEWSKKWLSMLSLRPSWGVSGHQPTKDYLYTSIYGSTAAYLDQNGLMRPENIRLTNLTAQRTNSFNLGMDLGFWDNRLKVVLEGYIATTTDLLQANFRIPSNAGYTTLAYKNDGKMRNMGWEFHIDTDRLIKKGDFTMDLNVNFGNNRNEILEMDENLLKNQNSTFNNVNAQVLTRIQLHNAFGSIYGFRSKGVYNCSYDFLETNWNTKLIKDNYATYKDFVNAFLKGELPDQFYTEVLNTTRKPLTAPVATNAEGAVIVDDEGKPIQMAFNYNNESSDTRYFNGGDAIYEDVNHDGNINALDIVYLGSSLPKLTGGFGFTFRYKDWRLTTQFTYRVGNKILNMARLNSEAMISNNNQSEAVNYRWRKEGDVTTIPRALYGSDSNRNTLVSDRFLEKGDYVRLNYLQLTYALKKKDLKWIGLNGLSFYLSANNLFVLTKYTGVDPEVSYGGYGPSCDWGQTPRAKSYTFGVTVKL